ncbi:hypothetical protein J8281_10730 [Aquimarina sp. U1-2]|uniref:hypothetical protein n=1 Tax=Aquimarina sp. U1-2 TaxID=2823141 RepID=UPI001AEC7781|nr:hypothetical protein [Aquimarina sp. U1-2]MBP2832660.1 hypothetical protein [Aquimarina sp. U1-2]
MKVIKDEDLLSLHNQIEKSEVKQQELEEILEFEAKRLKKSKKTNRLYGSFSVIFLLLAVFLVANAFYSNKSSSSDMSENEFARKLSSVQNELQAAQLELASLKTEKAKIREVEHVHLYRKMIQRDTIYSVQIKALNDQKISSVSEKFTNTLVYSDDALYKLSLGIFATLPEAQSFRKTLIQSGLLDKRIFVISYKDGKRIKIEDFQ